MLDKSINGALLALRKQIIRRDGEGQEHVEALLAMRGVGMPRVMPAKRSDVARRGHMQLLILASLRDGPKTIREIVAYVAERRPEISYEAAYTRTGQRLPVMRAKGLVRRGDGVWGLEIRHKDDNFKL